MRISSKLSAFCPGPRAYTLGILSVISSSPASSRGDARARECPAAQRPTQDVNHLIALTELEDIAKSA